MSKPKKQMKQPSKPDKCFRCDGTELLCNICGESKAACACTPDEIEFYLDDNPGYEQFDPCDECVGV